MRILSLLYLALASVFLFSSCSKKHVPGGKSTVEYNKDNRPVREEPAKRVQPAETTVKKPATIPKVISVNDAAASKSVDGRLFYDVNGKRYWKNYKDGKYYLFHKDMYNNPDFKPI